MTVKDPDHCNARHGGCQHLNWMNYTFSFLLETNFMFPRLSVSGYFQHFKCKLISRMSRIRVFPFSPKLQRTTAACAVSAAPSTVSQRRDWAAYCVVTHMTPWKFVTRNTQQTLWLSSGVWVQPIIVITNPWRRLRTEGHVMEGCEGLFKLDIYNGLQPQG